MNNCLIFVFFIIALFAYIYCFSALILLIKLFKHRIEFVKEGVFVTTKIIAKSKPVRNPTFLFVTSIIVYFFMLLFAGVFFHSTMFFLPSFFAGESTSSFYPFLISFLLPIVILVFASSISKEDIKRIEPFFPATGYFEVFFWLKNSTLDKLLFRIPGLMVGLLFACAIILSIFS